MSSDDETSNDREPCAKRPDRETLRRAILEDDRERLAACGRQIEAALQSHGVEMVGTVRCDIGPDGVPRFSADIGLRVKISPPLDNGHGRKEG
jgi:hypothetical protein